MCISMNRAEQIGRVLKRQPGQPQPRDHHPGGYATEFQPRYHFRLTPGGKKRATLGKMQVNIGFYGGLVPANAAHMDAICRSECFGR